MARAVDPLVRRFLERHSVSVQEEVEADVALFRGLSPAERWRSLEQLSRSLSWLSLRPPEHRARVLEWRDPPAPDYPAIVARLRRPRDP